MRTVKLTVSCSQFSCYGSNDLSWNYCSPIKKNGTISTPDGVGFTTCRELLNSSARRKITNHGVKGSSISFGQTRLVVSAFSGSRIAHAYLANCMTNGLKLVNHYEKKYKWALTKVYKVEIAVDYGPLNGYKKIEQYDPKEKHPVGQKVSAYMLIGPKEWMKSSHMTSLYILLLKIGNTRRIKGFKDHDDLVRRYSLGVENFSGYKLKKNLRYAHRHFDKFEKLMENVKEVFKGRSIQSLYAEYYKRPYTSSEQDSAGWEGIQKLCVGTSVDRALSERFKKVCDIEFNS